MAVHSHSHSVGTSIPRIRAAMVVVLAVAAVEIVVGRAAGSLALVSDSGHLATDVATLGLAMYAVARSRRPSNSRHTYGFHRSGIVVAGVNGVALLAVAALIAAGAVARLQHPTGIDAGPVIAVAAVAFVVNVALARFLAGDSHELATRSAIFHIAADAAASVGVIVAALAMALTGWNQADAVVSLGIAGLIGIGAIVLVREAMGIINEAVPRDLDANAVHALIAATPGVEGVHDLHIWSLDRAHRALSAHVAVVDQPLVDVTSMIRDLEQRLCKDFAIEHVTLQPESPSCTTEPTTYCDLDERHAVHSEPTSAATPN